MGSKGVGYKDRRFDRSEGRIRAGSCWPIKDEVVVPVDELLWDAAARCDADEVEAAVAAKANPKADGPLLAAATHGGAIVVARLAELGASVNARGAFGKTPLIAAAERGHADVVATLLRCGADIDAGLHPGGQTALHLVGTEEQCPLQMAKQCCAQLLRHFADTLRTDKVRPSRACFELHICAK